LGGVTSADMFGFLSLLFRCFAAVIPAENLMMTIVVGDWNFELQSGRNRLSDSPMSSPGEAAPASVSCFGGSRPVCNLCEKLPESDLIFQVTQILPRNWSLHWVNAGAEPTFCC
jgi:hypothetical protein